MSQQSRSALKVVVWFLGDRALEVWQGSRRVAELERANSPPVKRIERIGTRGDRAIEGIARGRELAIVHVEIAEFFVIARRRIVPDGGFQLCDALAARKYFERLAEQADVGKGFDRQIDDCAERPEKQNDKEPVRVRAAANEMYNRHSDDEENLTGT